jgi:hypothetical protein
MSDLFQGDALPSVTQTVQQQTTAPDFYTNYLQDVANLGQNAVNQGGVAGPSALQQQAYNMAPNVAFAGSGSMGAGSQLLGEAGATTVPDVVGDYMNPYTGAVVNEMGRLQQQNIQQNVLPNLAAAGVSSGSFGSQRGMNAAGQTLANMQANLTGQQAGALQTGYQNASNAAQTDLSRALQAGQSFGNLGAQQQSLGLGGLNELSTLGGQQQSTEQNILNYPMTQAQNFSRLMSGYQIPTGGTTQTTGPMPGAYSNSPLSQIAGLGSLLAALYGTPQPPKQKDGGSISKYADGGEVGDQQVDMADGGPTGIPAYHDGQGNMYDHNGYLVT